MDTMTLETETATPNVDDTRGVSRCYDNGWHVYSAGPCFDTIAEARSSRDRLDIADAARAARHTRISRMVQR